MAAGGDSLPLFLIGNGGVTWAEQDVASVALPAYNWLLTAASPALVGTSAFVNPVVAVLLGWALAGEALGGRGWRPRW